MKRQTLGLVSLILGFSISTAFAHSPLKLGDTLALKLGDGYVSYDKKSAGQTPFALSELSTTYSNLQENISLSKVNSRDDLAKTLNVDVSASGGWGSFSASAAANYMHHTKDTAYSENFTYLSRVYANATLDMSQLPYGEAALTPAGKSTYDAGIAAFTNRYGDGYIQQLPEGALLLVNMQLHFKSARDKSQEIYSKVVYG